ncbi:hypothetical protein NLG97_g5075 [Lecanicillium saksenae]|uniref:Uncharacterized protein n=1 Tax=Lecanicillium saksenae TaxID=468837 RepID=A0ACC1QU10_9HYPO|nr:hypothetical protein NLG97_g5075 [Lecanicillium saksenae]
MFKTTQLYAIASFAIILSACKAADTAANASIQPLERNGPFPGIAPCAVPILDQISRETNCSTADMSCFCTADLSDAARFELLLENCPFPDASSDKLPTPATQSIITSSCGHPVRDKSSEYTIITVSCNVVTKLVLLARLSHARFFSSGQTLNPDDWAALVTLVLGIPATAVNLLGLNGSGLGRDLWTLTLPEISRYAFYMYIMTLFYIAEMLLLKLSFCFLYLRIFSSVMLRRLLWATVVFHILFGVAAFVSSVLMCVPVDYTWLRYVKNMQGRCIDISGLYWTYGAITVAGDIWLLALPLRPVLKLRLHWRKKLGIAIMLMTGFLATIISIIRFRSILSFTTSLNATYDGYALSVWSDLEVNVGMICACLPSMRLLLARMWPRVFDSRGTRASGVAIHAATFDGAAHGTLKTALSAETIRVGYTELAPVAPAKARNPAPLDKTYAARAISFHSDASGGVASEMICSFMTKLNLFNIDVEWADLSI